jgi:hypothetical protein
MELEPFAQAVNTRTAASRRRFPRLTAAPPNDNEYSIAVGG